MTHRNVFDQSEPEEGPELPTVDDLIKVETDPDVLANLVILKEGLGRDKFGPLPPEFHEEFERLDELVKSFEKSFDPDGGVPPETDVRKHRKSQHSNLEEN